MAETLASFLASEQALINEAAEALPHQFSSCTYNLGPIRQAVYLCLTCAIPRGICTSCSIACHTDHEQVELFPKRAFRCDCPTRALAHPCTLHKTEEAQNASNMYGQNFNGAFCRCRRPYDAKTERETMIQCLACEDWFHESCLNLRERPPSRPPTPAPSNDATREGDDNASNASSSGLPPPLIGEDAYESLICRACVLVNPTLRRYAGTPGVLMVVRDYSSGDWTILTAEDAKDDAYDMEPAAESSEAAGGKRPLELSPEPEEEPRIKRPRVEVDHTDEQENGKGPCLAPPPNAKAQRVLEDISTEPPSYELGAGDVFLAEGFRGRWCQCDQCMEHLKGRRYLLEEEETYEPPEDPDIAFSLEELGLRALQRLPRDRAIEGIHAYNELRDELMEYLRPFAQAGHVVSEADVRRFFDERNEALRTRRNASQ